METITIRQISLPAAILLIMSYSVFAQDKKKFTVTPGADIVSSYVWRGMYQTGASVQPSLSLSGAGLLLTAWGSTDFSNASDEYKAKEFDLTCGYGIGRFNMAVTDYWWSGEGSRYGNYSNSHYFEGTLGFTLGEKFPLSLTWNTMFAGGDKNEDGDLQYSTFIEAKYSVNVNGIELSPSIGISPWTGLYSDGFGLNSISLKAKKDIVITDKYSLPLFAQVIAAPEHDNVFLILGISF
ncbi:MAG: TorF family putative porin [Parabacteroides sp.]